jgi:hypothetical protein
MPAEPAPLSPSFPATLAPPRLGRPERIGLAILAALAVLLLAAWQIPPLLDWSRYRGTIATYASARLGRKVSIAGQVRLTLLPRPMLMADQVSLADRGDGISARLGTLRLEVALGSLLAGHVVPRALSLDEPQARLPWPPPRGTAPHLSARAAGEFSATVAGGTLSIGGMTLRDITASLRTDPDTGAFAAQGNARVAGLPPALANWRFTALLGAPGADGVSPLNLTLDGRSSPRSAKGAGGVPDMQGTGGAFSGRLLADGTVAGTLVLRGPDLSRLGAGPALAWQARGAISANGLTLRAPALDLLLADSPGRATVLLRLDPPARLTIQAHLGQLPAGPWMWRLLQAGALPALATELDLTADAIRAPGGLVQGSSVRLSLDGQGVAVQAAAAMLPGGTRVEASGAIASSSGTFSGRMHMAATNLHTALRWLGGEAMDRLPPSVLAAADLRGAVSARADRLALTGIGGELDGSQVTGSLAVGLGSRPALNVDLTTDRLPLADWPALSPAALLTGLPGVDVTLGVHAAHLRVDGLPWPVVPMDNTVLQASLTRTGLAVNRIAVDLPGAHLEASGDLTPDGLLRAGHLDLAAPDAALLPASWRVPPALWQGGLHLALNGAGPRDNIGVQLRADLGDLRAEAEAHVDATAPRMDATATLRHPGAPRLLDTLGVPGARAWLGEGSVALLSHLSLSPGHVVAHDVSVAAGALQMAGLFDAKLSPAGVQFSGAIDAASLALPDWPFAPAGPLSPGWLRGLDGRIDIKAARVLSGLSPVATDAALTFLAGGGVGWLQDGRATLSQGELAGELVIDTTQDPPAVSGVVRATGILPEDFLPDATAITLRGGLMDGTADLHARGFGPAAWLASSAGDLHVQLRGTSLAGVDLAAAAAALRAGPAGLRARLQGALASGQTAALDGGIDATMEDGVARLTAAHLAGEPGSVEAEGNIDAAQRSVNLRLVAVPAVPAPPRLLIGLEGPWRSAPGRADVSPGLAWAGAAPTTHGKARARGHARKS